MSSATRTRGGFSLAELLVAIAILGFLVAMAIPQVVDLVQEARDAVAKRNAQQIAEAAAVAVALGDATIGLAADLDEAVALVIEGATSYTDVGNTAQALRTMDADAVTKAKQFLRFEGGRIRYSPSAEPEHPILMGSVGGWDSWAVRA